MQLNIAQLGHDTDLENQWNNARSNHRKTIETDLEVIFKIRKLRCYQTQMVSNLANTGGH